VPALAGKKPSDFTVYRKTLLIVEALANAKLNCSHLSELLPPPLVFAIFVQRQLEPLQNRHCSSVL
jgi:hypothetical protein